MPSLAFQLFYHSYYVLQGDLNRNEIQLNLSKRWRPYSTCHEKRSLAVFLQTHSLSPKNGQLWQPIFKIRNTHQTTSNRHLECTFNVVHKPVLFPELLRPKSQNQLFLRQRLIPASAETFHLSRLDESRQVRCVADPRRLA